MPFIRYTSRNNVVYATLVESVRVKEEVGNKKSYKIKQKYIENLGVVIDKEKGIFRNKKRGTFLFSLNNGFKEIENSSIDLDIKPEFSNQKKDLILDFGDSYLLNEYIKNFKIYNIIDNLIPEERDTFWSLLFFRMLTDKKANYNAEIWWEGNYISQLYPNAKLKSQRISEFLAKIGSEHVYRKFFSGYLAALYDKTETSSVLIDSTGLPNSSKMEITQFSNHNGEKSFEIRLIYVVDKKKDCSPIYFRYCYGNIIDVSTLCTTIAELKQYNISVDEAILDAGYLSEENFKELYKNNVNFIVRVGSNRTFYKELVEKHAKTLCCTANAIRYGNRLLWVKKEKVGLYNEEVFAYIGIDSDSRNQQIKHVMFSAFDDKKTTEYIDKKLLSLGLFIIISRKEIPVNEILPIYYTRQQIEQVFDITKNYSDILPIRVCCEETLRGHLLLTFIATVIFKKLQNDILKCKNKNFKINPENALMILKNQKCKIYEEKIIPQEAYKNVNDVYKLLKISYPIEILKNNIHKI